MTDSMKPIVVVGAGHNALVCANYLARGQRPVICLERADDVGGMASFRTFGDGDRVPFAHAQYALSDRIRRDLELDAHGYAPGPPAPTTALHRGGQVITHVGEQLTGRDLASADALAYGELRGRYVEFARRLAPLFQRPPPRMKNFGFDDLVSWQQIGTGVRFGLGREGTRELLRVIAMNVYDLLEETFDDERLKGLLALEVVQGSAMGPRTPGTILSWLHRLAHAGGAAPGVIGTAEHCVTPALVRAFEAAGGEIRTDSEVLRIVVRDGRVSGVRLASGEEILADAVVSGVDPRLTFRSLVRLPELDALFARRVTQVRGKGVVAKLHLALASLPEFPGVDEGALAGRLLIAPSADYVERAFNASKYGRASTAPVIEMTLPSLHADGSSDGRHVASLNVSYVPYSAEPETDAQRAAIVERVLATLEEYDPAFRGRIVAQELLTPRDIEQAYGVEAGHWHHGELSLHQSMMLRPVYGAAQYSTPVDGLFLCSAGCHPGGDVSGFPGRNAARVVNDRLRKGRL